MNKFHTSVLLQEIIEFLQVKENCKYIDATLGGGGHSFEILKRGGIVLAIDVDKEAIGHVEKLKTLASRRSGQNSNLKSENLTLVKGNFRDIDKIAHSKNFENVKGIIFDLGVSSHQLDEGNRGFSFQKIGPLDMRMDQELGVKAKDLIRVLTKKELNDLFLRLGEEKNAWRIAGRIVKARQIKPIETTTDLVRVIEGNYPKRLTGIHFATKVFQALRIVVNDELNALTEALSKAVNLLDKRGKILVISFHSLEDRIVKSSFQKFELEKVGKIITDKPLVPGEEEKEKNRRSRSAKLRVFEKS